MTDQGKAKVRENSEVDSRPIPSSGTAKTSANSETISRSVSFDPAEEYKMNNKRRGLALIFNQENFYWGLRLNPRNGTAADCRNLVKRFQELGFDVKPFNDLKVEEVWKEIDKAAEDSHANADCFVCVFLSHGEPDKIYANNGEISIKEVTERFKGQNCKSLVGKPKIFILQACRGEQHDDAVTPMTDEVDHTEENQVEVDAAVLHTLPAGADFLMCYSVAEGYYSHRETINGSWYVQDLSELLKEHGASLEFTELLTLVNRKVSMRSVDKCADRSAIGKKQVPCFASMLTKKLYFRPKKE